MEISERTLAMIELPYSVHIALNVLLWPLWQLSVSYLSFKIPARFFNPRVRPYMALSFERSPFFYERFLKIRAWKSSLPDGALFFAGTFSKRRVVSRKREYLERFCLETCRGELAHWISFWLFPVFALWNPAWAVWVMFGYACFANLPCIFVQRYNRFQLLHMLEVPRRR